MIKFNSLATKKLITAEDLEVRPPYKGRFNKESVLYKRPFKVQWEELGSYYMRWFTSERYARDWIQRELMNKAKIPVSKIDLVDIRS